MMYCCPHCGALELTGASSYEDRRHSCVNPAIPMIQIDHLHTREVLFGYHTTPTDIASQAPSRRRSVRLG